MNAASRDQRFRPYSLQITIGMRLTHLAETDQLLLRNQTTIDGVSAIFKLDDLHGCCTGSSIRTRGWWRQTLFATDALATQLGRAQIALVTDNPHIQLCSSSSVLVCEGRVQAAWRLVAASRSFTDRHSRIRWGTQRCSFCQAVLTRDSIGEYLFQYRSCLARLGAGSRQTRKTGQQ